MEAALAETPLIDGQAWRLRFDAGQGGASWEWRHLDLVHAQSRHLVEAQAELPDFARQVLLGSDETPHLASDGRVVAGVLPGFARESDPDLLTPAHYHFAMAPGWLITGRRQALRTMVHLWEAAQNGTCPASPAALIDHCIADYTREVRGKLAALARTLDELEELLLQAESAPGLSALGARVGAARRAAASLKRALSPIDRVLRLDGDELPEWAEVVGNGVGHRTLHVVLDDLASLADRARALQDELSNRLQEDSNRRLYVVSVVTSLFVPAAFVTGFFGMNTGGMLWSGDAAPQGTLYAALVCVGAVATIYLMLRVRRLI